LNLAVSSYNAFYRPHAPHHRKLLPAFALAQTADVTHLAGVLSQSIKGDYQVPPAFRKVFRPVVINLALQTGTGQALQAVPHPFHGGVIVIK